MTDLEEAWDRYPTSPAPVAQIVAEGTRQRRLRTAGPALGGLVAAGIAITLAVTLNGGGGATPPASTALGDHSPLKLVAFQADLKPATSCAQLLATYRQRGLKQVTAYGWNGGMLYPEAFFHGGPVAVNTQADLMARAPEPKGAPAIGNSSTGTNVQEVGVDEPDSVKTNGSILVRIDGDTIGVYDLRGSQPTRVSTLAFPYFNNGQILLSGTTLIALGSDTQPSAGTSPSSRVVTASLADPAQPRITSNVTYAGSISSARQHGGAIRMVLTTGLPVLKFVQPSDSISMKRALAANRKLVSESTLNQWLPAVDTGSGGTRLLDCNKVAITPATVSLGTTSVIGFDASAPLAPSAIGITGQTSIAYESADHLYLTANGTQMGPCACPMMASGRVMGWGNNGVTTIFQFDLAGHQAAHVATGSVYGSIADRWSMDEVGGILRVAATQVSNNSQTSSVVTMRQSGTSLVQVGRLDGLGRGETLTAARWFNDFAVISTAQQMDPLFTVDLTRPSHPKLLGALHIPGYTGYFHPIGHGLLLGVGQKVSFNHYNEKTQAQVGLFDISDLTNVKQLSVVPLAQWTFPAASQDPHAFTWIPDQNTALTSFSTQNGGVLLGEFFVDGRTLSNKLITVPANDPSTVRTLELPDGRVVLLAGGSVTFLSL